LAVALVALVLALPVIATVRFWRENDLSRDREAQAFVARTLEDAAPGAVILTAGDGPTFALWYAVYGLAQRPDVAPVNVNLLAFAWYRRALAGRHPDFVAALDAFDPARPEVSLRPWRRSGRCTGPRSSLSRCRASPSSRKDRWCV
jgi:hypothetical protein